MSDQLKKWIVDRSFNGIFTLNSAAVEELGYSGKCREEDLIPFVLKETGLEAVYQQKKGYTLEKSQK